MRPPHRLVVPSVIVIALACSSSGRTTATTAAPTPAPAPAAARPAAPPPTAAAAPGQPAGQPGGLPGGAPAPPPLTPEQRAARRDSIGGLRAQAVQRLLQQIAGHEKEPAGQVFKNVQLLKDMPAGELLTTMDQVYGRALSLGCTSCHVRDQWDSDSLPRKKTARIMIQMVNAINSEHLSKMPPNRAGTPRRINCITCHRGNGMPGIALLP